MTKTILHIDASVAPTGSASRAATAQLVANHGEATVIYRDLTDALPQITGEWATARLVPAPDQSDADKAVLALSDTLLQEIISADHIVIGLPIYNFGMPASLKAWLDLIVRPNVSFKYTETGPLGLLDDTPVTVAMASGGTPIGSPADFATPHLAFVLGFIGLKDVTFVKAQDVTDA